MRDIYNRQHRRYDYDPSPKMRLLDLCSRARHPMTEFYARLDTDMTSQLAEADLATQARMTAAAVAQNVQKGTKGAADQFNKFVEGAGDGGSPGRDAVQPEKKDFWDSFGSPATSGGPPKKSSAIGTAAMRGGGRGSGEGGRGGGRENSGEDGWDEF